MPPRKNDAMAQKSDAGVATPLKSVDEHRTVSVATQELDPVFLDDTTDPLEQAATEARPATAERERETPKQRNNDAITIEDLNMPRSIITRLAKGVLPPNTQIQGSAITGMSKSATVFISHLANAANNITTNSGKKTIMPADVFAALDDIEFGFMREQLEAEFAKFNHIQTSKRSDYRKRVAAAKKGVSGGSSGRDDGNDGDDVDFNAMGDNADTLSVDTPNAPKGRDVPPQSKKAKRAHGVDRAGDDVDGNATELDEEDVDMEGSDEDVKGERHDQEVDEGSNGEEEEEDAEDDEDGDEEEEDGGEEEEEGSDDMEEQEGEQEEDEALDSDSSE